LGVILAPEKNGRPSWHKVKCDHGIMNQLFISQTRGVAFTHFHEDCDTTSQKEGKSARCGNFSFSWL